REDGVARNDIYVSSACAYCSKDAAEPVVEHLGEFLRPDDPLANGFVPHRGKADDVDQEYGRQAHAGGGEREPARQCFAPETRKKTRCIRLRRGRVDYGSRLSPNEVFGQASIC